MPREVFGPDFEFLAREEVLSFEEIRRAAGIFIGLGVTKLRLTGGEPLVRRDVEGLVEMLAGLQGLEDLAMTTNGSLLARKAAVLRSAGLRRVTVSLDALDPERFRSISDTGIPVDRVLEGIDAAVEAGFHPVKVNMVVKRGMNEDQIVPMADRFRSTGIILRFIEFMDVGTTNGWRMEDVVPADEIRDLVDGHWPLEPLDSRYEGEVANRYRYTDGAGEIGIISSVTRPFCATCTRARLTARGEVFTCLFGTTGHDLRELLRSGRTDAEITDWIREIWLARGDRYSELRSRATVDLPRAEMFQIGG
jgi:GTP 3',8-cyclase